MSAIRSATAALVDAYRRQDTTPGEGSPPSLLAEALEQVFAVFDRLDRQHGKATPCPARIPRAWANTPSASRISWPGCASA